MKRIIALLSAVFLFLNLSDSVFAEVSVSAKSAVAIDAASGRILFEKDAHTKRGMASTTKIMTALVAIENLRLDDIVTVSPHAAGIEGSSIWLSPLEKISVNDLLYGLMLASGNDAATALAEHTSGSEEAFIILMNRKAKEIGAYNTNFTNPHGLSDEKHYTTAYDLALISAAAMENSLFAEIAATKNKTISWEGSQWRRSLSNHNKLLKMYPYATGVKTGYTKKDGRCLVSGSEKDGGRIICVTLSAPDDWNDHINMSEYCFNNYAAYTVCSQGEKTGSFINEEAEAEPIGLLFEKDYVTFVKENEAENIVLKKNFNVNYPVTKGDVVGRCDIFYLSEQIGSVNLIAANDSAVKETFVIVMKKLAKGIMKQ